MAQIVVDFGWRDPGPEGLGWTVHRVLHAERAEDVSLRKFIERAAGEALDDFGRQDDAEVGVDLFRAGLVVERLDENAAKSFLFAGRCAPVFLERRQA